MSWIDDDHQELLRHRQAASELAARESEIATQAERVYNDLWTEITERIAEARDKKVTDASLLTNGSPYRRALIVVRLNVRIECGLALAANKQSIVFARSKADNLVLPFELGEDGVVRIKHDGECLLIADAAKLLLRPLLFPEMFDIDKGVKTFP